jgi:hypothetical protein
MNYREDCLANNTPRRELPVCGCRAHRTGAAPCSRNFRCKGSQNFAKEVSKLDHLSDTPVPLGEYAATVTGGNGTSSREGQTRREAGRKA